MSRNVHGATGCHYLSEQQIAQTVRTEVERCLLKPFARFFSSIDRRTLWCKFNEEVEHNSSSATALGRGAKSRHTSLPNRNQGIITQSVKRSGQHRPFVSSSFPRATTSFGGHTRLEYINSNTPPCTPNSSLLPLMRLRCWVRLSVHTASSPSPAAPCSNNSQRIIAPRRFFASVSFLSI